MTSSPNTALESIQRDLFAGDVPVTRILQNVILLGGQIGSTELRTWARRELDGYGRDDELPEHRKVQAQIYIDGQNGNSWFKGVSLGADRLPDFVKEKGIGNELQVVQGLAEIEQLASRGDFVKLALPGGDIIARFLTKDLGDGSPWFGIERVYYSVSTAALRGVVEGVRTALSDLISELVRTMPADRATPTKEEADRAVGYTITGNQGPVTVNTTTASGGGAANTSISTAIGTSTSTSTASSAPEADGPESWWTRTRKRGAILALFALAGSTAGILNWLHIYPFS